MIAKGKLTNIGRGLEGGFTITVDLPEVLLDDLKKLQNEDLLFEITKNKEPRSGRANSYFHVLVGKIAKKTKVSNAKVKNELIGLFGQPEMIDGQIVEIDTEIEPDKMAEREFIHTVWTDTNEINDRIVYTSRVMRGSHTLSSEEFAALLEGTIAEAKSHGIETLPPDEILAMENAWKGSKK